MNLRFAVRLCDLVVVYLAQPIVCRHRARVGQDKSAHGVRHGGVFLHAPVVDLEIVVDGVLVVEHRGVHLTKFLVLLSVENVCFCHFDVAGLDEHHFHRVLNVLNAHAVVFHLIIESRGNAQSKHIDDVVAVVFAHCAKRFFDCHLDFVEIERNDVSVSFFDVQHSIENLLLKMCPFIIASVRDMSRVNRKIKCETFLRNTTYCGFVDFWHNLSIPLFVS